MLQLFLASQFGAGNISINSGGGGFLVALSVLGVVLGLLVQLIFAFTVLVDANKLRRQRLDSRPKLFGEPWLWFLATLVGGVFVAAAYWLIHRSNLNPCNLPAAKLDE